MGDLQLGAGVRRDEVGGGRGRRSSTTTNAVAATAATAADRQGGSGLTVGAGEGGRVAVVAWLSAVAVAGAPDPGGSHGRILVDTGGSWVVSGGVRRGGDDGRDSGSGHLSRLLLVEVLVASGSRGSREGKSCDERSTEEHFDGVLKGNVWSNWRRSDRT